MSSPGDPPWGLEAWRPAGARPLAVALDRMDRLFDRLYSSRLNPLYRTGTLAALFLTLALVTGVYLLFVYEVARPYESVRAILVNIFGGIARGDEVARGLVEARSRQTRRVPMVVRIVGTNAELAADILRDAGDDVVTAPSLDEAVNVAVALARRVAA